MEFVLTRGVRDNADRHFDICNSIEDKGLSDKTLETLVQVTGLTRNIAKRYFKRECGKCGGSIKHEDIGMFHRYCGRYGDLEEDKREYLCRECLSSMLGLSIRDYRMKTYENYKNKCTLF